MIAMALLGLLGCGRGAMKEGQVVAVDDLTWVDEADRRLFVDLAA